MLGLKALQHEVLEGVARSTPVAQLMNRLCQRIEQLAPEAICSILSVDASGRLRRLAAPSLPEDYSSAIDGIRIGPSVGSCGTAAFLGEPVEVADIANDPLWSAFKDLALSAGLRACWSWPIHASDGRVIGTFAFYYRACQGPGDLERAIVQACVNLCAIAIEQEERKASIQRLAYFDPLTGVANRAAFEKHGREELIKAMSEDAGVAIHWIDLDKFKSINDTLGHQAGDTLLKTVADRFTKALRPGEFIARIGGDEFVVLQSPAEDQDAIEDLALRLGAAASQPVTLNGKPSSVSASIGIARAPQDGDDLIELMKKADLALYEAKSSGRRRFSFFNCEIEERIASSWRLEQDIKDALANKDFELHFQPLIDLGNIELSGFEALLRWRRPGHGLVGPQELLAIAEKTGLIYPIDDWVLHEACRLGARLPEPLRVSVNLSPTHLGRPRFALDVAKTLAATGLSPLRLELEITESALLVENSLTFACLSNLRQMGVSIALDDFGTGYSALSHLRAFPVDRIKIDRSFVKEVDTNHETASIVRAIVGLARELGVKTTAEGIETESQLKILSGFGCTEIQGYLVSRPKPPEAFDIFGLKVKSALNAKSA